MSDARAVVAELAAWVKLTPAQHHQLYRSFPDVLARLGLELAPAGTAERYARALERESNHARALGAFAWCRWCERDTALALDGTCARCGQHVT